MSISLADLRIFLTAVSVLLVMGCLIHYSWKKFRLLYKKPIVIKSLLKGFKAKMWMTFGLGIVFFGFYFLLIGLGSSILNERVGPSLFWLAYHSPVPFIYGGLLLFACFSLLIYLVRMVIKYLFLTRGKGD